jgi:hypothetical protein
MAATIGQRMRLLCRVYGLKVAKREALLKDRNNIASNRVTVLRKPECGVLNAVRPYAIFFNVINGTTGRGRQASGLILRLIRITSLSTILFALCRP